MKIYHNIFTIITMIKKAREYRSFVSQIFDIIKHKIKININPYDYYRYEFYKPGKDMLEKSLYVSVDGSMYYPYDTNLIQFTPLLDNKFIFKILIDGLNFQQAKLITTVGKRYHIKDKEDFNRLMKGIDCSIVFKPIQAAEGIGVFIVEYVDGDFFYNSKKVSNSLLWDLIGKGESNYLVEEKIVQDNFYSNLHPYSLNTYRVITIKLNTGWQVLLTVLRIGQNGSFVDNTDAGGIVVYFDSDCISCCAYDSAKCQHIEFHPDTGVGLKGKKFPAHEEVLSLALRASEALTVMGTIGWDIGVTENGPIIVEANLLYGCTFNQMITGKPLLSTEVASQLEPHYFWKKWDRSRMYPAMKGNIKR